MQKALVYPYDSEFSPVLRHKSLLCNLDVVKLVSPRGWGFTGMDASAADGGDTLGIKIEDNFEMAIEECDTLLLVDSICSLAFEKYIMPKVRIAAGMVKNIICTRSLNSDEVKEIEHICRETGSQFKCYIKEGKSEFEIIAENRVQIETPVVFVAGTGERSDKFEVQLSLREELIKRGYSVCQIGTRSFCELLGFHSMPDFILGTQIKESQKVCYFNHYIKQLETREKPDIIIIGIPGGIMPINDLFSNQFGIIMYEISQAVQPDYSILCSHNEEHDLSFYKEISEGVNHKFGFNIDCHIVSHIKIDWMESQNSKVLSYLSLDKGYIDSEIRHIDTSDIQIMNIYADGGPSQLTESVINRLSDYAFAATI